MTFCPNSVPAADAPLWVLVEALAGEDRYRDHLLVGWREGRRRFSLLSRRGSLHLPARVTANWLNTAGAVDSDWIFHGCRARARI